MAARAEKTIAPGGTTCCTLAELLALRALAAPIDLGARPARVRADPGGAAPSRQRGRGIEFEEVRAYAPGDDVRSIDWRVTARTGRPHTRVFRAERDRPVYLLIDQRAPLRFGSRVRLKSVQALRAATLLAWAALATGDRVGGLVLDDAAHHELRPRRSRHAVLELLRLGLAANTRLLDATRPAPANPTSLTDALAALRRVARPGSLALLISDFQDFDADAARQLHLLARHVEVQGLWVLDELERALPAGATAPVTDGRTRIELALSSAGARARHAAHAERFAADLHAAFRRNGAPLRELETQVDTVATLVSWFGGSARP